ncbi:MAG: DUF2780 domain-containing protein [Methylicorpusculum sp.]|uniref:DUF2780 domain-containing protein n=1 Tax=Methylicorpusculum sp. TaxID=2713644 RepID=UPI002723ED5C|nr:DUF2780 domain-containing protein [Methylicorpusculum sp.]MDO8939243.1 DUF2780 domain-containing protein [Methylicorpusculum sp.]MDP2201739.1 DUF2780 domain-containing protein [Methylicorpusculum sp.]
MKLLKNIAVITSLIALAGGCAPAQQGSIQNIGLGAAQSAVSQQAPLAGVLGNAASDSSGLGLVNVLVNQLGISPVQALGGAGSIFSVAKQSMNAADFSTLSNAVPGMDQYLSNAPKVPAAANSSLLGTASGLLGNQAGGLGNLASLASSFQTLGMNSNMISQFVPVVMQYVQQQGGAGAMSLLQNALY